MAQPLSYFERLVPFEVQNFDSVTIPAYGGMLCNGTTVVGGAILQKVYQPSTTFSRDYLINGPEAIAPNGFGQGYRGDRIMAACDYAAAVGDGVGFRQGQCTLSKGFLGARVISLPDSTNNYALVTLEPIVQLLCQATTSISASTVSTGNQYKILCGTLGSESDAGFTTVPNFLNGPTALVNNDKFVMALVGSGWLGSKWC